MITLKQLEDAGYRIEKLEKNPVSYYIENFSSLSFKDLEDMNFDVNYDNPSTYYDTECLNTLLITPQDRFNLCEVSPEELRELCEKHDNLDDFDEELVAMYGSY